MAHPSASHKVKIVCTLGPSSQSPEVIARLIAAGMDVARLNFSHGSHEFHRNLIQTIRAASHAAKKPVAILQDLQGPKLRVGKLPPAGIQLQSDETVLLHPEGSAPSSNLQASRTLAISDEIARAVALDTRAGDRILFDDGKIQSRVLKTKAPEILIQIERGGKLTSHKGMNLPDTPLSIACLTEKDLEDLKFGLSQEVDAVALSFVRTAQDVDDLRREIKKHSRTVPLLISKIERREAIENQDSIIETSDGLLIARGDMAVEIGAERVPCVQKQLIATCNELGVPVITATQMLESMISSPTPTRAEASDVANAVFDGTDAVMLSGETASGEFPVEAVQTMARIALESERSTARYSRAREAQPLAGSVVDAIESSASRIASQIDAAIIACLTHSGMAARTLAKHRPKTPIVAIMDDERTLRRLAFTWGVRGALIEELVPTDDVSTMVEDILLNHGWAERDDLIVITAGIPTLRRGTTNMIKVHRIGAPGDRLPKKEGALPKTP